MGPGAWDFSRKAAAGYVLHNIYNALENCFEQISRSFENHVVDDGKWHAELLGKMFLNMEGLRPPLFPSELRPLLNDLRGFRHVFRHGYGIDLDEAKLERLLLDWKRGRQAVLDAIEAFAVRLSKVG